MSDISAEAAPAAEAPTAPVAEAAATPDVGTVDATVTSADAAPTTEPASSELYTVKVGGEEQQVTLDELRNGYMRQADYTRKTQAVSEQAKDLEQAAALMAAFDRDPHGTLAALADAYNWTPAQTRAAAQELQAQSDAGWGDYDDPNAELDPIEQRLAAIEQTFAEQQKQAVRERIEADFRQLEEEFGEIDRDALIAHTIKRGLPDVVAGYRDMTYEAQRAEAAALKAKREAQLVEGGQAVQPNAVSAPPAQKDLPLREQIRMALRAASS